MVVPFCLANLIESRRQERSFWCTHGKYIDMNMRAEGSTLFITILGQ